MRCDASRWMELSTRKELHFTEAMIVTLATKTVGIITNRYMETDLSALHLRELYTKFHRN